jgi:outer membrane protein TolC
MKNLRLLAALPLLAMGLSTTAYAAGNIATPEQLFPQLDGILKQAVSQSPRMISRAVDLEIAEHDRIAARAALLPTVGGYYTFYEAKDKRADLGETLDVTKIYYNFSITQPLYHWGDRRNTARIGEIRQNMAEGQYRNAYRLLAQEVRATYFRLILDKLRAKKASFYLEYANNQLKQGEERLAKKVISDAAMFGIRAAFDLENDKASFARLTGSTPLSDDQIPDMIPLVGAQSAAVQSTLASFLAQDDPVSIEAANFRQSLDIERLGLAYQKNRLRPKFNFVVGTTQDEQSYTVNTAQKYQVTSYYAGISINWTLFDGFAARSGVRGSLAKVRQMERDYRLLTERLAQQAQTQAKLAEFTARQVSINDRYLESSEGYLNTRREEHKRGVIAEEDLHKAQLGLFDTQLATYSSRAEYLTALAEFLGTVMEDPVLDNLSGQ